MRTKVIGIFLATVLAFGMLITAWAEEASKTVTEEELGTHDGYDYELWKDSGTTSMTLGDAGAFSCSWSDINNALFRKGLKFDKTQTYEELGNILITYDCDYNPNGNSYLCVYGWSTDPLVEYYIVDSWGSWRPPGATSKATITVDDGTYDVYETTRIEQPSIEGTATFQQYWSVRTSKRTSGTISVSEHFKAWESLGMTMGKMYEASLLIEGYQSSGTADILSNVITVGGDIPQTAVVVPEGEVIIVNREGSAAFGTPELDGNKDDLWTQAQPMPMDKMLIEPYAASGTARVLWDYDNLYVLFEVNDNTLDNTSDIVHEKDSVEAFVDEANCKLGDYKQDDGQYRVCYDGSQSFGDSTNSSGFESSATVDGSTYTVEMKIPFKTLKPEAGMQIGFDAQVNDAQGGTRTGISKWSDASDNSWQDTSAWGVVTLLASEGNVSVEAAAPNESTENEAGPPNASNEAADAKSSGVPLSMILVIGLIVVGIGAFAFIAITRKRK